MSAKSVGEAAQSVLPVIEVEVRYRTRHGNGKTLSVSARRNTWWDERRLEKGTRSGRAARTAPRREKEEHSRGRERERAEERKRLCQYKPVGRLHAAPPFVHPSELI